MRRGSWRAWTLLLAGACGSSEAAKSDGDGAAASGPPAASEQDASPDAQSGGPDAGQPRPIDPANVRAFDGATTRVAFGPTTHLERGAGESLSISVWIRPNAIDGYDTIFGRPTPCGNAGNYVLDFAGQRPRFCYRDATQTVDHCAAIGASDVPLGEWTHVAMTYTFGHGDSFRGYVNGELTNAGSWYAGDGNAAPYVNPRDLTEAGHFAGCSSGSGYFYRGDLYQLAVYDRAISREELASLHRREVDLPCARQSPIGNVELTLIDGDATGYATFQSHNQKVLANQHGIFVSYIRTRNEAFTAQEWRLVRSTDGGATFKVLFDETTGTNPPVLDTDPHGNLYVMKQRYDAPPDSTLMIFRPENDFAAPESHTIPNGNSGKFSMLYDWRHGELYYFSHEGRIYRIALDGTVLFNQPLIVAGPNGIPQYPYLSMDEDGVLYAAWTAQKNDMYMYRNIGAARSRDRGVTWERFDGTPLTLPIVCDETGAANAVSMLDELDVHTWLWNFLAKNGKVHFQYLSQRTPMRQNYVRFDAASGIEDLRIAPSFGGATLSLMSLDGLVASDPGMPNRLFYAATTVSHAPRIGVVQSTDNGSTWHDFAGGGDASLAPYALGGARHVSDDGMLMGTFTDTADAAHPKVYFFRTKTRNDADPVGCL